MASLFSRTALVSACRKLTTAMEEPGEECGVSQMLRLVHGGQVDRLRAIIGGAGDVAELCTTSGEDGWSVFTLAADLGNAEVVRLLCDARVPVNQPNKVGTGHDIRSYHSFIQRPVHPSFGRVEMWVNRLGTDTK